MNTYLVVFNCLTMSEPYFEHIKADNLDDAWQQAYEMSRNPDMPLAEGDFEIYKWMTPEDYMAGRTSVWKKIAKSIIVLVALLSIMFAEYRFIMHNIHPYRGEGGTVYLEVLGQVDEYYADEWED